MYRVDFLSSCEIVQSVSEINLDYKKYKFPEGFSLYVTSARTSEDAIELVLKEPIANQYHWYIHLSHAKRIKITHTRSASCLGAIQAEA